MTNPYRQALEEIANLTKENFYTWERWGETLKIARSALETPEEPDPFKTAMHPVTLCAKCGGTGTLPGGTEEYPAGGCCRTGHSRDCKCILCQWIAAYHALQPELQRKNARIAEESAQLTAIREAAKRVQEWCDRVENDPDVIVLFRLVRKLLATIEGSKAPETGTLETVMAKQSTVAINSGAFLQGPAILDGVFNHAEDCRAPDYGACACKPDPRDAADTNTPLRMHIALKILRAWNHGTAGFDARVVGEINAWIDAGMKGPVPWPDSPFFAQWAREQGYSRVGDAVGFRIFMRLVEPKPVVAESGGKDGE